MTASYDFYSPWMAATIITAAGERVPLWTNTENKDRLAAMRETGLQSLPFLQEVSVTLNLSYVPTIRATLTPPYQEGIKLLDSELVEWGVSQLEVVLGYTGGSPEGPVLAGPFTGTMLKPDITIGQDIVIVFNAQGVGAFSAIRQEGRRQFNNQPRAEIVLELIAGPDPANPRELELDDSAVIRTTGKEVDLWANTPITLSQGNKTDWQLIYELVNTSQCYMRLEGKTLRVIPKSAGLLGTATKTFQLYPSRYEGRLGAGVGVWPILRVSSPTTAVYMPGALRGIALADIESKSRQATQTVVGDAEVAPARSNDGSGQPGVSQHMPGANEASLDGTTSVFGSVDDPRVRELAEAEYSALTSNMGVRMIVGTFGVPDLVPAEVVMVRGLGTRISGDDNGRYMVHRVTHTMGPGGGFETEWDGVSNTASLATGLKSKGPTNKSVPDENADASRIRLPAGVPQGP